MNYLQILTSFWLFSFFCFGQVIEINNNSHPESSYGPEQLIKKVLISSDCSSVSDFSEKTKGLPTDLTTKSYGYFKTPAGSSFPFLEGVILSTGRAHPAGNNTNRTLISYMNQLSGDLDLENALNVNNTQDATFFKFNFTPQVDEISFRFLMGSEEYDGKTECQYADSFAFLLREIGTQNYINLAVLPDGTPVSVKNINNSNKCRKNPNYFSGYNINTTNYSGLTKVLTAKSAVTPGKTYEIKLVVADQGDDEWDSAIFLEAGSFDLGGDLGPDQTIANGNPGCTGTPIILDAKMTSTGLHFKWYKNNVEIVGEKNSKLHVTTDGTYKFEVTTPSRCTATDEVVVEFTMPPIINNAPVDLFLCATDDSMKKQFDFSSNEILVLGPQNPNDFTFTYHKTKTDADSNLNALTTPYTNVQQKETIWQRIADNTQSCYKLTNFKIIVKKQPKFTPLEDYYICGNVGDATFDLTKMNGQIKGDQQEQLHITYHISKQHLEKNIPIIDVKNFKSDTNPQTIFVRVHYDLNNNKILDPLECVQDHMNFKLIKSYPPKDVSSEFIFSEFTSPNKVKVNVGAKGNYEYALNNGPWQKENILLNVTIGEHSIHVRDLLGCGLTTIKILNIDYPKYFTPNGDGYHDYWNISSLKSQANAKIYIFDRYGKMLKELSTASDGWDGTFNGYPMPTTDYWFVVEYHSPTTKKKQKFRANFTLKR